MPGARGDTVRERRVLEVYVAHPVLYSHAEYLRGYLHQHGHDDFIDRITTKLK